MRTAAWESRLADYIEQSRNRPFAWGENDCCLWAARWVKLATGRDYTREWIGRYATEREAKALMNERGFVRYSDIADSHLEIKPVMLAQRGDLMLRSNGSLGICHGRKSWFVGTDGLITEDTLKCLRAWKV